MQAHREGNLGDVVGDDHRPKEVVPGGHALIDAHGRKGGLHKGDHDLKENPVFAAAIHPGRIQEVLGDAGQVLPKEKHQHRHHQIGKDNAPHGVDEVHAADQTVERKKDDLRRHHHNQEHAGKGQVFPLKVIHGKAIAHAGAKKQGQYHLHHRDNQAVAIPDKVVVLAAKEKAVLIQVCGGPVYVKVKAITHQVRARAQGGNRKKRQGQKGDHRHQQEEDKKKERRGKGFFLHVNPPSY